MTTQISTSCIRANDICDGSYGCGSETEMAVLARVVPVFADPIEWDKAKAYEALTVVRFEDSLYITKVPTPPDVDITDGKYWGVYNDKVYVDRVVAEEAQERADADEQLEAEIGALQDKFPVSVENGGTGADNSRNARINLSAANGVVDGDDLVINSPGGHISNLVPGATYSKLGTNDKIWDSVHAKWFVGNNATATRQGLMPLSPLPVYNGGTGVSSRVELDSPISGNTKIPIISNGALNGKIDRQCSVSKVAEYVAGMYNDLPDSRVPSTQDGFPGYKTGTGINGYYTFSNLITFLSNHGIKQTAPRTARYDAVEDDTPIMTTSLDALTGRIDQVVTASMLADYVATKVGGGRGSSWTQHAIGVMTKAEFKALCDAGAEMRLVRRISDSVMVFTCVGVSGGAGTEACNAHFVFDRANTSMYYTLAIDMHGNFTGSGKERDDVGVTPLPDTLGSMATDGFVLESR